MKLKSFKSPSKEQRTLVYLIAASLLIRLLLIFQHGTVLLSKFLGDDAFYYFELVRNIVSGNGAVFNQGIVTNGFHPLYAMLLVPIFKMLLPYGEFAPVYASLVMLSIFSVSTAVFIYLIVKQFSEKMGLFAAFIWLFNPAVIFTSLIGVETPIQIFFIALLTWYLLKLSKTDYTTKESVIVGLLIAIIFLSRMDGVLFGLSIGIMMLYHKIRKHGKEILSHINDLLMMALVALVVVSPWLIWSKLYAGSLMPVSGAAFRLIRAEYGPKLLVTAFTVYKTIEFASGFIFLPALSIATPLLVLPVALFSAFYYLKRQKLIKPLTKKLDFVILAAILHYSFYWFYQSGIRYWYAAFTFLMLSILFAVAIPQNRKRQFTILASLLFIIGGAVHYHQGTYPQEKLKYLASKYLNEELDGNVGSFNTGIYQYFSPKLDVINLDGVMNPEAFAYRKEGKIEDYIIKKKLNYLIDHNLSGLSQEKITLEPVKVFHMDQYFYSGRPQYVEYTLYKVSLN